MPDQERILFVGNSRIGDAVLASGLLARLVETRPNARFTIAAGPLAAPLFAETPRLERLHEIRKQKLQGHWLSLWNAVRKSRWDLVIDLRGGVMTRVVRTRRGAALRKPAKPIVRHKVIEAAEVMGWADDPPAPRLFVSAETAARAEAALADDGPLLAIGPGASRWEKVWPAEKFAELAARLLGPGGAMEGGRLAIFGSAADARLAEVAGAALPAGQVIDLCDRLSLLEVYTALGRARLFVGNDSGLMHLAAAAGAPTLGLFGPTDERLYAPWGPLGRVVRPAGPAPCPEVAALGVEEAFIAANRLLQETAGPITGEGRAGGPPGGGPA
jgi:ADP-heptose:LPS heptosyltransferase